MRAFTREKGSAFLCKHILAAKLAQVLEMLNVQMIQDDDFGPMYLCNKSHLIKYDTMSMDRKSPTSLDCYGSGNDIESCLSRWFYSCGLHVY
jgi:hypothetical protein